MSAQQFTGHIPGTRWMEEAGDPHKVRPKEAVPRQKGLPPSPAL